MQGLIVSRIVIVCVLVSHLAAHKVHVGSDGRAISATHDAPGKFSVKLVTT